MATFTEAEMETEAVTTPLFVHVSSPDAMNPRAAAAAASSVVPAPDAMDPRSAASVKIEFHRNMIDLTEMMTRHGLIGRPPPKRWFPRLAGWFLGLTGWFRRLTQLWRVHRRELATDRQLVKDCLDYYNRKHPGNEYEPVLGNVSQNPHWHNGICWVHGNFVARKKGSGIFSFLIAPWSVFFFELAYMEGFNGVVTCTTVEEPAGVVSYPHWWGTYTSGKLDSFCKTCGCRFVGVPYPGIQKISACGHNNVAEVCEMCYCRSHTLHPGPGEFAFGYRPPYYPYPKR